MLRVSFWRVFSFTLSRLSSSICYIRVHFVIKFSVPNLLSLNLFICAPSSYRCNCNLSITTLWFLRCCTLGCLLRAAVRGGGGGVMGYCKELKGECFNVFCYLGHKRQISVNDLINCRLNVKLTSLWFTETSVHTLMSILLFSTPILRFRSLLLNSYCIFNGSQLFLAAES